jgi:diadenylate cyclase
VTEGVGDVRALVVRDYVCAASPNGDSRDNGEAGHGGHGGHGRGDARRDKKVDQVAALDAMAKLSFEDLTDLRQVGMAVGLLPREEELDASVETRGYRFLHKLPRLPPTLLDRLVDRFSSLQRIMRASIVDLEQVDGVGEARAKSVKEGLARLAETSILERYNS